MKIPIQYKKFVCNLIKYKLVNFYESSFSIDLGVYLMGLPQGSTLSLLLFNLYVKDILKCIPHDCKAIQFADDVAVTCSHRDLNKIITSLQLAFNQIQVWLQSMGLEISVIKTQFMVCHRSKFRQVPIDLQVNIGFII